MQEPFCRRKLPEEQEIHDTDDEQSRQGGEQASQTEVLELGYVKFGQLEADTQRSFARNKDWRRSQDEQLSIVVLQDRQTVEQTKH